MNFNQITPGKRYMVIEKRYDLSVPGIKKKVEVEKWYTCISKINGIATFYSHGRTLGLSKREVEEKVMREGAL